MKLTYWRGIAVLGLIEIILLMVLWPLPFGWRDQLRAMTGSGFHRVDLLDPLVRFQVTNGKQSVDDDGHVIECATSTHPNCHPK